MNKYGLDKFYTKPKIVEQCLTTIDISEYNTIIEPSAGDGAFFCVIPNCIGLDLKPEHPDIEKIDFFQFNFLNLVHPILVIGNPPFGRQSSLAIRFFNHASLFADTIAFVVPKSFKKESVQDKLSLNFSLTSESSFDEDIFSFQGKDYMVPCVWQVWKKQPIPREKSKKYTPTSFEYTTSDKANCSIRRVGVYAGKAFLTTEKSKQSHYFIKVNEPELFVDKINQYKWEHDNTVGPRSISKNELTKRIDYFFK